MSEKELKISNFMLAAVLVILGIGTVISFEVNDLWDEPEVIPAPVIVNEVSKADFNELKKEINSFIEDINKVQSRISVVEFNQSLEEPTIVSEAPKVIDGVVHVMCPGWQGSGFAVSEHLIVTARHVVEGVEDFVITTNDGHKLHATRAMSMKNHDVGFIYVDDLTCVNEKCERDGVLLGKHQVHFKALELSSIEECELGQEVFAIGSPYGKINFNNLTSGIISGLGKDWEEIDPYTSKPYGWSVTWITSVVGHPGNSGCPVFTLDGKVRGILVGGFSPVLICCMPVDLFAKDLQEIERMFVGGKYQVEKEQFSSNAYGVYQCH